MPEKNPFDQFDGAAKPVPVRQIAPIIGANPNAQAEEARASAGAQNDETRTGIAVETFKGAQEDRTLNRFDTYRKEYLTNDTVKQFKEVEAATRQIVDLATRTDNGGTPGPGDIATVISFMKALDPGSVVREGEFATAQNAGGVPETVRNAYNSIVKGDKLSPQLQREFANTAIALYNSRKGVYNNFTETYRGLVQEAGGDPDKQGIRLAEDIRLPNQPGDVAFAGSGGRATVAAGDSDSFLTTEDQQAQAAASQLWASGATFDQWQQFSQQFNRQIPFSSQADLDAMRSKPSGGPRIVPSGRDPRADMGFIDSATETVTGSARATDETNALPDWTDMPAPEGLSGFLTGLATMATDPQETAQILVNQIPGTTVRVDNKGNYIIRNGTDGKEYAIKPGFKAGDVPRAAGSILAFSPAGRATSLAGGFAAGAATQAGVEATQAAAGGNFDLAEVGVAGVGNAGGVLLQRGVSALGKRLRAPAQEGPSLSPMGEAPAPPQAPAGGAGAITDPPPVDLEAAAGGKLAQAVTPEQGTEFGEVAKAALGRGKKARAAKEQLAAAAQTNPEAKAAAERLGIELPVDVIADDARLLTTQGLARSQIGSGAQAEWGATVRSAIDKSDATLAEVGASRDLAQLSDDVRARLTADTNALEAQGNALRGEVNAAIDVRAPVAANNLRSAITETVDDLGGAAAAKNAMSAEEKKLFAMIGGQKGGKSPTYAFFNRVRDDIGRAIYKNEGPWATTNVATLKRYYAALAKDQLDHVESVGGKDLADKMRGSNDLYTQMFRSRETMQSIFGQGLEKDIGTLVTRAIGNASKGDAQALRTVLAAVPKDMQSRTLLSGLMAKAERSSAGGGFSFDNFAKMYRGLRQNSPIYAEIAKTIGPRGTQVLQDLYVISSRMSAAEAKIVRTGAANQSILNAIRSEGLLGKVIDAGKRVGARGAGAVIGGVTGGPVGAAAGQEVSGALIDAVTTGGKRNLDQLHSLLSSDAFRDLVVKAGTGNGEVRAASKVASDPAFVRFGKALGLDSFDSRRRWIIDAMTTPLPVAANTNISGVGASINASGSSAILPLAAGEQPQRADKTTTAPGPQ